MRTFIERFHKDERGVTMVEYGIMAALIAVALVTAIGLLTGGISTAFSNIATTLGT